MKEKQLRKGHARKENEIKLETLIPGINYRHMDTMGDEFLGLGTQKFWMDGNMLVVTMEDDSECLQTIENYSLPIRIEVTVMTDRKDIRLNYLMAQLIFNCGHTAPNPTKLDFIVTDVITEKSFFEEKPVIPPNKFVDISWIIEKEYMEAYVDGVLYYKNIDFQYINILKQAPDVSRISMPVRIGAGNGSTITVKSLKVTEL